MNALHTAVMRFFEEEAASEKRGSVLEAGAGPGDVAKALTKLGFSVKAVDIEPEFRGCAKAYLNDDLKFAARSFDYVVCLEVVEHI